MSRRGTICLDVNQSCLDGKINVQTKKTMSRRKKKCLDGKTICLDVEQICLDVEKHRFLRISGNPQLCLDGRKICLDPATHVQTKTLCLELGRSENLCLESGRSENLCLELGRSENRPVRKTVSELDGQTTLLAGTVIQHRMPNTIMAYPTVSLDYPGGVLRVDN